jgi:hypothetical protein
MSSKVSASAGLSASTTRGSFTARRAGSSALDVVEVDAASPSVWTKNSAHVSQHSCAIIDRNSVARDVERHAEREVRRAPVHSWQSRCSPATVNWNSAWHGGSFIFDVANVPVLTMIRRDVGSRRTCRSPLI